MQFMLLFSRQGKLRLQKWYVPLSDKEKKKITRELVQTVLARKPKMCSFLEWRDLKVVYKSPVMSTLMCLCTKRPQLLSPLHCCPVHSACGAPPPAHGPSSTWLLILSPLKRHALPTDPHRTTATSSKVIGLHFQFLTYFHQLIPLFVVYLKRPWFTVYNTTGGSNPEC
uniref:AP complex mu/sigma subunit domain-containing protein n=1 Tax=Oncorhynchus tshawytscha TaxID=74940 RepID=A0AAZ3S4R0_ONCTS